MLATLVVSKPSLDKIAIIENSFHPGMGLFIARGFEDESNGTLKADVFDSEVAVEKIKEFSPDVVILD